MYHRPCPHSRPRSLLPPPSIQPSCSCSWGDPYGGQCTDTFVLQGDTLTQVTDMSAGGRHTQYR